MRNSIILSILAIAGAPCSLANKIPNYPVGNKVLGPVNFTSSGAGLIPSASNLGSPSAIIIDPVSGKAFVSDTGRNRILRFPNVSTIANGGFAEAVFGQTRFSDSSSTVSAEKLKNPLGLHLDRFGRLWVADTGNHRILMYEAAIYRHSGTLADRVYGQPDFVTAVGSVAANRMNGPSDVYVDDNDNLWVTDTSNHRVLRFDTISGKSNGAAADGVLGQNDFITATSGTNASKMTSPVGVLVSRAGTLFVGTGNRIVRFNNAAALGNGAGASAVLGQPNFTSTTLGCSATSVSLPYGVFLTPADTLWVADISNNRCLRYDNASSLPTGSPASGVVGQPNFTANTFTSITSRSLNLPYFDLFVDAGGNLWCPDFFSSRVIRFPQDLTKPTLTVAKPAKSVTKPKLKIRGTAADFYGISGVFYKIGNKPATLASGKNNWVFNASLAMGKNRISIWAIDSVGNTSFLKRFTITRK